MPDPNCNVNIYKPDDPGDVLQSPMQPIGNGTIFCKGNATYGTLLTCYQVKGMVFPWPSNTTAPTIPDKPPDDGWILGEVVGATGDFRFGDEPPYAWLMGGANSSASTPYPKNTVAVWAYFPPDISSPDERICRGTLDFGGRAVAPAPTLPGIYKSLSFTSGPPVVCGERKCDEWIHFRDLPANAFGPGNRLVLENGDNFQAASILIYVYDIHWRTGSPYNSMVRRALGNYLPAPAGWKFPGSPQLSINVYQPDPLKKPEPIASELSTHPHAMNLNPLRPVYLQVNDLDTYAAYNGHQGTYSVAIRVIA